MYLSVVPTNLWVSFGQELCWLISVGPCYFFLNCKRKQRNTYFYAYFTHLLSLDKSPSFFHQLGSVAQSCPTLCDPMDCRMPGFPVHHQLLEPTQTHVHWVSDAIQLSHPLKSPFPPTFNLSQHQGLFWWVSSSHQVMKVLELQLQHQSFQWIFRTDFL